MKTLMRLIYFLFLLIIQACNANDHNAFVKSNADVSDSTMSDNIFKKKVIVILSKDLERMSNNINIQDFIKDGVSFIPVFTSIEKFDESTKGDVKNPKVEIEGIFLLSILQGTELLKVNPGLKDEEDFKAADLIKKYLVEITRLNTEMKHRNENN
jgi:hypothetical protein